MHRGPASKSMECWEDRTHGGMSGDVVWSLIALLIGGGWELWSTGSGTDWGVIY